METESSAELMAPSTAVKGAAPAKEQPLSSGPKTGPGKAGGFKKILSKCERMALADQKKKTAEAATLKKEMSKADKLALKDEQAKLKLQKEAERLAEKAKKEEEKRVKEEEKRTKEEEKEAKVAEREAKKVAKEEKAALPKKPQSAYLFFSCERRAAVKDSNPETSFAEVAKLLGNEWAQLSDEDKRPWEEKAVADKERYASECEAAGIELKEAKGEKRPREVGGTAEPDAKKRPKAAKEPKVESRPASAVLSAKTAIQLYKREHRSAVAEANPEAEPPALVRMMEESFAALSEEDRAPYEARAAADLERYNTEMAAEEEKMEAERAVKTATKESKKEEAKAAQKKEKAVASKADKKAGKAVAKAKAKSAPKEVELRKPTEAEAAVLVAVDKMRKEGIEHESEIGGWKLKLKVRPVKEDGKLTGGPDMYVTPPGEKKALMSVVNVKRKMGILGVQPGAPAEEGAADAPTVGKATVSEAAEEEAVEEEDGAPAAEGHDGDEAIEEDQQEEVEEADEVEEAESDAEDMEVEA